MEDFPDNFYQSLLLINNALVRETTREGLFRSLAVTLQPLVRCDRCSLSIYDAATDSLEWFARAEGLIITGMDDKEAPLRGPLAREAIRLRAPYLVPDLRKFTKFDAVQRMVDAGLRWSIALPLMSRAQPVGVLSVSFMRPMAEEDKNLVIFLEKISVQVALAVDNMLAHTKLQEINSELQQRVGELLYPEEPRYAEARFFHQCDSMRRVVEQARLLARSNVPVLICGETGTGKEFIAHFIHHHSPRKNSNFVKVNCPALSSTLFESELFGHAKGAFTGASSQRVGRFEMADNGSIFMDEIGDLDKALQAKLLQVLQDACFERVGESRSIQVNVRFISATNAALETLMRQGEFRQDLYYRLGAATIHIPPLRERQGEIPGLMRHLMAILTEDMQCRPITFNRDAQNLLEEYHWPGNVREFSNMLKRLLILHPGCEIRPDMIYPLLQQEALPASAASACPAIAADAAPAAQPSTNFELADAERRLIEKVLTMTNGVVSGKKGAAALLGLPRSTLLYKLQKHGILPDNYAARRRIDPA